MYDRLYALPEGLSIPTQLYATNPVQQQLSHLSAFIARQTSGPALSQHIPGRLAIHAPPYRWTFMETVPAVPVITTLVSLF